MSTTAASRTPGATVDLSQIKSDSQRRLFKLLDKFEGTKTIVWDENLIGPFEFVATPELLRKHDATKLVKLSGDARFTLNTGTDYTLFFIRKDYQAAKFVANVLHRADRLTLSKVVLVLVPQRCASIEKLLEHNKLDLEKLHSVEELNIELFVLDTDLISMENEFVYRDIYLNEDYSAIHQVVEGLDKLQDIYGQIPRISGQGKACKMVCDLLLKRRKLAGKPTRPASAQIQQLVLIDRRVDLITPFLTQLTYEGLLDEIFSIKHGTIKLPAEKFFQSDPKKGKEQQPPPERLRDTKTFSLRSTEELYGRLRDCHINAVAETLKKSAKNLQAEYDECKSEGKTIHEMGKIVQRLNHLKNAKTSQSNHVTIAELLNEQTLKTEFIYGLRIEHDLLQEESNNRIIPEIDTLLLRQANPLQVLRLICAQSIINNGLKPKILDQYKREVIQNYGDNYLLFLLQLEKSNLLLCHDRLNETASFSQLKSKFNLINDNVNECNPNHFAYVYGGYAPLSVMLTRNLIQFNQGPQWRSLSETLRLLPEPTINHSEPIQSLQNTSTSAGPTLASNDSSASLAGSVAAAANLLMYSNTTSGGISSRVRRNSATSSQSSSEEMRTVLVFFIGGCTFAEISALRFLSQQEENNCDFIVGTTKIINGTSFLKSLWPLNDKAPPA